MGNPVNTHEVMLSLEEIAPVVNLARHCEIPLEDYLSSKAVESGDGEVPLHSGIVLADYFRLLRHISLATGDEALNLSKRKLLFGSTDLIVSAALRSDNLHEAMRNISVACNLLHGGEYNRVESGNYRLNYVIDDADFPYAFQHDSFRYVNIEFALLYICGLIAVLTDDQALRGLRSVHSKRPKKGRGSHILTCLQVPVQTAMSRYVLSFDAALADLPVCHVQPDTMPTRTVSRKVLDLIEGRLSHLTRARSAAMQVVNLLEHGVTSQKEVAERLIMSVATLKRRLLLENTSFSALRNETLNKAAKRLLARRRDLNEVSEYLGYSDVRSFRRAFKKWNGISPSEYLRKL